MKHLRYLPLAVFLLANLFWTNVVTLRADEAGTSLEYKVKAVVLFNFAKYIRWPEKVFSAPDQPIRICILGDNPFREIFSSNQAPKEAQSRPFQVVEVARSPKQEDLTGCRMLYWRELDEAVVERYLPVLQEYAVLTVSDRKSDTAIISFVVDSDKKVKFRIRRGAAEALGLNISSQLLKLAILDE